MVLGIGLDIPATNGKCEEYLNVGPQDEKGKIEANKFIKEKKKTKIS